MSSIRLTVDTGGTFSDFVSFDEREGNLSVMKVPSTPDDPSRAILSGLEIILSRGVQPGEIGYFCHGTTVGTNALLEGKGVKTGLLITEGFRGIYEVAEQARPHGSAIFDVLYAKPALLVSPSATGEVRERVTFTGEVLEAIDEEALRETLRDLRQQDVASIGVCLLFSFLFPRHEERVREIIAEEIPGCSVSISSEIAPQIREYYRLSTTVINAYLQPILERYIRRLDRRLAEAGVKTRQKYMMQSNGGMATFDATARKAVATLLSGPAGGVTASVALAAASGFGNIVTLDMGGTSCDVALINRGEPALSPRGKIEGRDIAIPMMDINTVSAGGGTIAQVDRLGVLKVGPESAGAVPGPACYARGGTLPTITDCDLVLGYVGENGFLGGQMRLDPEKARRAVLEHIAQPLGIDLFEAAEGVVRIINVKMEEAIKAISTMRGHDLRDFMLLPFGGAGPIHAGRICQDLRMAGMIVPLYPGVFSAIGLLMSDVRHDHIQSRISPLEETSPREMNRVFEHLEEHALAELLAEGFSSERITLQRSLDLRYAGQGYELMVPCASLDDRQGTDELRAAFDRQHKLLFGHMAQGEPVEIVSYRLQATGRVPNVEMRRFSPAGGRADDALSQRRPVHLDGRAIPCPIYQRERLDLGVTIEGPAVIEQFDSTTVVYPGQVARVDELKSLIVTARS
jgi:N-methylhydantoinase A